MVELRLEGVELTTADMAVRLPCSLPVTAIALQFPPRLQPVEARSLVMAWLQPGLTEKLDMVALSCSTGTNDKLMFPELFAAVARSGPQLRSLSFEGIDAHEEVSKIIALTQLTKLQLVHCDVYNNEVKQLSALTGLRYLSLAGSHWVGGHKGSIEALAATMRELTTLRCPCQADAEMQQAFEDRIVTWLYTDGGQEYRLREA